MDPIIIPTQDIIACYMSAVKPGKAAGPERDCGTAAAVAACVHGGADAIRVHNVVMGRDAVSVSESICLGMDCSE